MLRDHLAVDRVNVLRAAIDFNVRTQFQIADGFFNVDNSPINVFDPLITPRIHQMHDAVVLLRIEIAQRQILQLPFDGADPQSVGNRRVDFQSFVGNPPLFVGTQMLQRPHIVQAVSQFNDHHTDILAHCQQKLTVRFGHLFFVGLVMNLRDLGVAIHDHGNRRAKKLANIIQSGSGIFNDIMHVARAYRFWIHVQIGQDAGNLNRMDDIGLARLAMLVSVRNRSKMVGALNHFNMFFIHV